MSAELLDKLLKATVQLVEGQDVLQRAVTELIGINAAIHRERVVIAKHDIMLNEHSNHEKMLAEQRLEALTLPETRRSQDPDTS
jgi:hypothetical protein